MTPSILPNHTLSMQPIGTCSLCGGIVMKHVGAWGSILPPPPARCSACGATEASLPIIPMIAPHRTLAPPIYFGGAISVCPEFDRECGRLPSNQCKACPLKGSFPG